MRSDHRARDIALLRYDFSYGILMLDWAGSGTKATSVESLELELDSRLSLSWGDRAKAIVIDPELDAWVWGSDNALTNILDWSQDIGIRAWLAARTRVQRQKKADPTEGGVRRNIGPIERTQILGAVRENNRQDKPFEVCRPGLQTPLVDTSLLVRPITDRRGNCRRSTIARAAADVAPIRSKAARRERISREHNELGYSQFGAKQPCDIPLVPEQNAFQRLGFGSADFGTS